jgi:hypothetical protein
LFQFTEIHNHPTNRGASMSGKGGDPTEELERGAALRESVIENSDFDWDDPKRGR